VQSLDTKAVMTLADLGEGGFSVRASQPLPLEAHMRFRFSTPDGSWTALLTGQSVYTRVDGEAPAGAPSYITGFKFLHLDNPRVADLIHALIDRATAVISFS